MTFPDLKLDTHLKTIKNNMAMLKKKTEITSISLTDHLNLVSIVPDVCL